MAELGGAAADAPRKANPQQTSRGAAMVLAAGSEIGATFISEMDRIGIEQVCSLHLLEEEEEEEKKDRTSSPASWSVSHHFICPRKPWSVCGVRCMSRVAERLVRVETVRERNACPETRALIHVCHRARHPEIGFASGIACFPRVRPQMQ